MFSLVSGAASVSDGNWFVSEVDGSDGWNVEQTCSICTHIRSLSSRSWVDSYFSSRVIWESELKGI